MRLPLCVSVHLLVLCLVLGACAPAATPTPRALPIVRICYSAPSAAQAVPWYAFEKGLFQKYGVAAQLVSLGSGTKAAAALIARQVDFCQMAGSAVVNAAAADQDLVLIGGLYDRFLQTLVVGPAIQKPEELIGKGVAISSPGGASDTAARIILKRLGLEPDKQVTLVAFQEYDEQMRLQAVDTGQVAGAILSLPIPVQYQGKGFHELLDSSTLDFPYQRLGIVASRSYVQANRTVALNVLKALTEAVARMKRDPDGSKAVIAKYMSLDVTADAATLSEDYDVLIQKYLQKVPDPSVAGMQTVINEAAVTNPKAAAVKPEQVIDASLVRELVDSGFIDSLYR